ncbi:MAG TPA: hypothetical protein PK048_03185 [Candidatus Absconditabacterales bacterium]|nr:hypothetical protein [Candidatus Absconditabacterales bacterium]
MFGYRIYLQINTVDFSSISWMPTISNVQSRHSLLKQELITKQDTRKKLRASDDLMRYDVARYINNKEKVTNRSDNINNLIRMYTELQNVARNTNNGIVLSDFTIQQDSIQVRGQIKELKYMYIKNGIIDRFSALDFVNNITIPYYQKNQDYFDFILKADVISQKSEGGTGSGDSTVKSTGNSN